MNESTKSYITNNENYFLNIHILQSFPPSCMNRDGNGDPKSAIYGGVHRGRVSSQCIKSNIRYAFTEAVADNVSVRTKKFNSFIRDAYIELFGDTDIKGLDDGVKNVITASGLKDGALFPLSKKQIENLARIIHENKEYICTKQPEKLNETIGKACTEVLSKDHAADVVLFGNMLAGDSRADVELEACCQVAHALSTHEISNQEDYFTAIDDYKGDCGAAMIGTTGFHSYTLYKYADVEVTELFKKLPDLAPETLRQFLTLFALQVPSGKQNSFANTTFPCMIYITLDRKNISLVDAFEDPIEANHGYSKESVKRFIEFVKNSRQTYLPTPIMSYGVDNFGLFKEEDEDFVQITGHLSDLIENIVNDVKALV